MIPVESNVDVLLAEYDRTADVTRLKSRIGVVTDPESDPEITILLPLDPGLGTLELLVQIPNGLDLHPVGSSGIELRSKSCSKRVESWADTAEADIATNMNADRMRLCLKKNIGFAGKE